MEEQLSKKERKDLRHQEKREGQIHERRMRKTKKLVIWAISLGVIAVAGWFGIQALTPEPLGEDYSRVIPQEGGTHVQEGTRVLYQSNPPTSGNHWATPLRDGIYDVEKPDEAVIHSLEHGRVWITYKPDIGQEAIAALKDAVKGQSGTIMSPRVANETDIALAVWTRLDTFNLREDGTLDAKRVREFIQRYRNKGPEYVPQNTGKTYE
ncbi:DUF3105 domain-containing protein [Patescibacteria group bacterium]|nr:DUF3105 domain-containing protein [Patescibacteria group bacterium]